MPASPPADSPLAELGLLDHPRVVPPDRELPAGCIVSTNPTTGRPIAGVLADDAGSLGEAIERSRSAFERWRSVPAPERGEVVRRVGLALRERREALGRLVSLEVGKIQSEGVGEVQETIDIADFAVGLSRTVGGRTMPSERAQHRLFEQWHPLGPIGVITAFNFPNAVWGWNAMVAAVCGDTVLWKPSPTAALTALATNAIADAVAREMGHRDLFALVVGGDDEVARPMVADRRLPLISATGSCAMGRSVGAAVASRLGRCLLELGGNNAAIVQPDADLELAVPSLLFAAVGTAGQRCTTMRRLLVHRDIAGELLTRLTDAYARAPIGDPLAPGTLVGPLIGPEAVEAFERAIAAAREQGCEAVYGGSRSAPTGADGEPLGGWFVTPTIVRVPAGASPAIARQETFAPILYVFTYEDLDEAVALNNDADQGLSSAIFTDSVRASERFLDASGSDCGIANVNIGTSGAEIGGAFGGEKDTGGGREAGSDAWKAYMRRQTGTVNFGGRVRLAQGVRFG